MTLGNLHTNKSWVDSLADLRDEFRKWGVEDYLLPIRKESEKAGSVTVSFAVRGTWVKPECRRWQRADGHDWLECNLRAIVMAVHSVRVADQRGLGALLAETTRPLALPAGDDDPHSVLGVAPTASASEVRQAYLEAAKRHHPDRGGDPAMFKRINEAARALGVAQGGGQSVVVRGAN